MNNMKKQILLLLTAALLASCNDWLDVTPTDKQLEKDLFATESGIQSATNGLYREMTSTNLYGGQLSQTTIELMAHFYAYDNVQTSGSMLDMWSIANFQYDNTDVTKGRFSSIWSTAYSTLLHINVYIKNLKESTAPITDKNRNILLGEAYGLRAYLHFDLFRLFGPAWKDKTDSKILPYHNSTAIKMNQTGYEEQVYSTADEYMTLLWEDLNLAEDLLEATDPVIDDKESITARLSDDFYQNRNRRMNYYAVKGLQARVHQYCGNDNLAAIAAKVVTDRVGEPNSSGTPFRWATSTNVQTDENYIFFSEVIFGINDLEFASKATGRYMSSRFLNTYVVDQNNLLDNILVYDGELEVMPDVRTKQWVISSVTDLRDMADYTPAATYISKKYRENAYTAIPAIEYLQVLMRTSEMYYIQAEAALKASDKTTAIELLNELLGYRGLDVTFHLSPTATDAAIQAHLVREYYREFFGEGQVFFFHKRRGSTSMFSGNNKAGSVAVDPATAFVVPIPESEKNS
jgi:hypothetical protein